MKPNQIYKIIIPIALLVLVVLVLWQGDGGQTSVTPNQEKQTTTQQPIIEEGGESFDPVSIPALMLKEFDGRDLTFGRVLDENDAYTRFYITYKSSELTISGIMNIPKGNGPIPVLSLNHGHIDTKIYTNGRGLKREQDYLARRGFAVLHSDYRNHADSSEDPEADVNFRLGYVEDVINAIYGVKNSNAPQLNNVDIH